MGFSDLLARGFFFDAEARRDSTCPVHGFPAHVYAEGMGVRVAASLGRLSYRYRHRQRQGILDATVSIPRGYIEHWCISYDTNDHYYEDDEVELQKQRQATPQTWQHQIHYS
jgi:hypothetical protein